MLASDRISGKVFGAVPGDPHIAPESPQGHKAPVIRRRHERIWSLNEVASLDKCPLGHIPTAGPGMAGTPVPEARDAGWGCASTVEGLTLSTEVDKYRAGQVASPRDS